MTTQMQQRVWFEHSDTVRCDADNFIQESSSIKCRDALRVAVA